MVRRLCAGARPRELSAVLSSPAPAENLDSEAGRTGPNRHRLKHFQKNNGPIMDHLQTSTNILFILLGAIVVLFMHAGFAFLELGTVRSKNQVNALVKILADFSVSTLA